MRRVVADVDLWAPRGLIPLASETTAGQARNNSSGTRSEERSAATAQAGDQQ
jgi:hypothetical protein